MEPSSVDSVIVADFRQRASRAPQWQRENDALLWLVEEMARSPREIFQRLSEAVQKVCPAQSAGVSLLDRSTDRFVWPALVGAWAGHAGGSVPRREAPCGTVLERDTALLFSDPHRHFPALQGSSPPIVEALLVPFYVEGTARGTIWAIVHDRSHAFDAEDERLLTSLSRFTAAAYRTLSEAGALHTPT